MKIFSEGFYPPPGRDILASVVVFLVALPLCMGISIASGVPPALGLITGIVGGLVVGFLAGSPLQVSGPAAGLAVIIWELVHSNGLEVLGLVVLLGGIFQFIAGIGGLGRWFRAVSPAVIQGMLAGIGVLIFASQFHVMLDDSPKENGLTNLMTIPGAIINGIWPLDGSAHHMAALVGIVTISTLVAWTSLRPKNLKAVPGPLIGVICGSLLANALGLDIKFVEVPDSLIGALNIPSWETLGRIVEPGIWGSALALALIASAESLLCATAVDQMQTGPRTNYNRELWAQGVGNIVCGCLGALPMTGVIVRSSANVDAGASTRWSAIFHGAWLLGLVAITPFVLELIPTAALAAILVYTGYKLAHPSNIRRLARFGRSQIFVYLVTLSVIVATDLLKGVLIGLALAVALMVYQTNRVIIHVDGDERDSDLTVRLAGVASFLTLPTLAEALEKLPEGRRITLDYEDIVYIDQAVVEMIEGWRRRYMAGGGMVHGLSEPELVERAHTQFSIAAK